MNRKYNLKLDLQFRCNNSTMKFDEFDNNTSDFFIRVTRAGELIDISKAIVTLVVIKPDNSVDAQFVDIDSNRAYCDLKPTMKNLVGKYEAIASITVDGETVNTGIDNPIIYEVTENKFLRQLNQKVVTEERFTLLTDMINRLSTIEISEEQRVINEAERILSEENRKIEEAKRVEAELIRQHEEADRAKYDATRESNENIRKQNESIRLANETNRIDEEVKRVEEENKRKLAEEERNANYNFMTEDEDRRRSEANAHKEAEKLRAQAEITRVNEEAKRRTTEQARVSAENTRVSNENIRKTNEETRQTNETHRVEAETQRQNRYNSFILEAEANASNFENYTNSAKVKEEERKSNELDRKSQEARRVSNEVERISNENTRKANEVVREKNETSRQYVFENKVDEVDSKISELDNAKSDMTNTVLNKVNEVENRFNALTSKQQQDAEVIDARDGETSLKARLDRDIEKAKQVYVNVEGSHISTDSSVGYLKDIEILGNTIQSASNLADIRSVGDKVEGQELYEIPVLSYGKNLFNKNSKLKLGYYFNNDGSIGGNGVVSDNNKNFISEKFYEITSNTITWNGGDSSNTTHPLGLAFYNKDKSFISRYESTNIINYKVPDNAKYFRIKGDYSRVDKLQLEEGTVATQYEPYQEDKLTILSPVQPEKVGDVRDRIIEKDGVLGVEKNIVTYYPSLNKIYNYHSMENSFRVSSNSTDAIVTPKTSRSICNLLIEGTGSDWTSDKQCCYVLTNNTLVIKGDIRNASNLEEAREWIKSSGLYIKYPTTQPQFIPLPHDQQVKLRTFANKTNISFGCEIEGTIKAQVPKSLGATVNTHTEQIRSLNNELNRVKKLEESTVSTVTTESDFTTVEATSNGYFEGVKLEGRTLVNLVQNAKEYTLTRESVESGFAQVACDTYILDKNKDYTAIYIQISREGNTPKFSINNAETGNADYYNIALFDTSTTGYEVVIKKINRSYNWQTMRFYYDSEYIGTTKFKLLLLEGDHTQNPPNGYIEGLKSVGEDTDEIVVESVNENLLEFDSAFTSAVGSWEHANLSSDVAHNVSLSSNLCKVTVANNSNYHFLAFKTIIRKGVSYSYKFDSTSNLGNGISLFKDLSSTRGQVVNGDFSGTFIANDDYNYIALPINREVNTYSVSNFILTKDTQVTEYAPYQSDKKRLLYYNEETQAWEKPILREWDSIEKHANGKYYYHVRSIEEDYVEGDEIVTDYITDMTTTVKPLSQEKVYECTNIDLITYNGETNYIVESGVLSPKTTLKVHSNISNVVSLLQKKVSLLESDITSYMTTQNRLMLASRYNSDAVSFKVDYAVCSENMSQENYDTDLYNLILNNILVGKDNYDYNHMFNIIMDYASWSQISWDQFDILVGLMDIQHNPPIEEIPTDDEIVEEIPNEIM